jgi:DNA-binding response OmpR family regulator
MIFKMKNTFSEKDEMLVLIVENSDTCCKLLSLYLERAGVNYISVSTGLQAIKTCKSNLNISHVLLSILLPGIDGIEVCKAIKEIRPELEIIFLTAFTEPIYKKLGIEAGASHYITKPINYRELLVVLFDGMD